MFKKFIIAFFLIFFCSVIGGASPFLVCDPQEGVETYEITQDSVVIASDIVAQTDGSLKYDLDGIVPGVYTFSVKACTGPWGCSDSSDPYQSPEPANKPTGTLVTP